MLKLSIVSFTKIQFFWICGVKVKLRHLQTHERFEKLVLCEIHNNVSPSL